MAGYGATRAYRDNPFGEYTDEPGLSGKMSYNELCDSISSSIFKINNNSTALERSTKQIGTEKDSPQLRDRIHDTEQNTNRLISETARTFRSFSDVCSRADRQQKLQYERLKNEFQDTVQRYNSLQKRVAAKVKSAVLLSSRDDRPKPPKDLISWGEADTSEDQEKERRRQQQQLQAQMEVQEEDLALLREREAQIRQLEADILDINEIFRDLGTLVHEQGETIDTIEANVEAAYSDVEQGNEQLIQAAKYQKKARKKQCILALILVIVAAVIAVIIYVSVK